MRFTSLVALASAFALAIAAPYGGERERAARATTSSPSCVVDPGTNTTAPHPDDPRPPEWETAPQYCNRTSTSDELYINGTYYDQGCGTVIHPSDAPALCLGTRFNTTAGDLLFLACTAGDLESGGGRWSFQRGLTHLRNMQVGRTSKPDYCITADTDRLYAVMDECETPTSDQQIWDVTDAGQIVSRVPDLAGKPLCLDLDESAKVELNDRIVLRTCNETKSTQKWAYYGDHPPVSSATTAAITN